MSKKKEVINFLNLDFEIFLTEDKQQTVLLFLRDEIK